jgi:hypothetical protein
MAIATLRYDLSDPDDLRQHRYALAGLDALLALESLEQAMRAKVKWGELPAEAVAVVEELRQLVPAELTELLH